MDFLWLLIIEIVLVLFAHVGYFGLSLYNNLDCCRATTVKIDLSDDDGMLMEDCDSDAHMDDGPSTEPPQ